MLDGDRRLRIYVNGSLAGTQQIELFIPADPNEGMQIGNDTGTRVGDYDFAPGFVGLIDEVRIFDGQLTAAQVRASWKRALKQ